MCEQTLSGKGRASLEKGGEAGWSGMGIRDGFGTGHLKLGKLAGAVAEGGEKAERSRKVGQQVSERRFLQLKGK